MVCQCNKFNIPRIWQYIILSQWTPHQILHHQSLFHLKPEWHLKKWKLPVGMISNHQQLCHTHNHHPNNHNIIPVMETGKRIHLLMVVISGLLKVEIGLTMKISHINTHKITVMMVRDEVDTEDEVVDVDSEEEDSEGVEVVAIIKMAIEVVIMVVVVVDIEGEEVEMLTVVVVMDIEAKEVADEEVSEVKMDPVEVDSEVDVVVIEVTVVMVDIAEGSEACTSINNRCV